VQKEIDGVGKIQIAPATTGTDSAAGRGAAHRPPGHRRGNQSTTQVLSDKTFPCFGAQTNV